jgi:DNA repair exonuclease SbcCD nuclease subunit
MIKKLSDHNILTVIIMGNHDYKKMGDSFTSSILSLPSKNYPNVRLLIEPEVISCSNKNGDNQSILLIPYRDRRMYSGNNSKEYTDSFNQHIESLSELLPDTTTNIAVGHNFFYRGNYFDFGGMEVLANPDSFKKCELVVMGHLHEFSQVKKSSPQAYYVGSLEKTNFGDKNIDKYFLIFDSKTKETTKHKIPVRDLKEVELDLLSLESSEFSQYIEENLDNDNFSEKIIKIKVKIKEHLTSFVSKVDLEKRAYAAGAFFVSKIVFDIEQVKFEKNKEILQIKNEIDMFEAYVKSQITDSGILEKILEESKKIMVNS